MGYSRCSGCDDKCVMVMSKKEVGLRRAFILGTDPQSTSRFRFCLMGHSLLVTRRTDYDITPVNVIVYHCAHIKGLCRVFCCDCQQVCIQTSR